MGNELPSPAVEKNVFITTRDSAYRAWSDKQIANIQAECRALKPVGGDEWNAICDANAGGPLTRWDAANYVAPRATTALRSEASTLRASDSQSRFAALPGDISTIIDRYVVPPWRMYVDNNEDFIVYTPATDACDTPTCTSYDCPLTYTPIGTQGHVHCRQGHCMVSVGDQDIVLIGGYTNLPDFRHGDVIALEVQCPRLSVRLRPRSAATPDDAEPLFEQSTRAALPLPSLMAPIVGSAALTFGGDRLFRVAGKAHVSLAPTSLVQWCTVDTQPGVANRWRACTEHPMWRDVTAICRPAALVHAATSELIMLGGQMVHPSRTQCNAPNSMTAYSPHADRWRELNASIGMRVERHGHSTHALCGALWSVGGRNSSRDLPLALFSSHGLADSVRAIGVERFDMRDSRARPEYMQHTQSAHGHIAVALEHADAIMALSYDGAFSTFDLRCSRWIVQPSVRHPELAHDTARTRPAFCVVYS